MGEKIRIIIVIIVIKIIVMRVGFARAQPMSSQNFRLEGGNFSMTAGVKQSPNFTLSDVVGQTAASLFASKGYLLQAGFLNAAAGLPFVFSVSPTAVDFGPLSPNMAVTKNLEITIKNGDTPGYSVYAAENQPPTTTAGAEIVDTVCDPEGALCSQSQASSWQKNNTYGFGFRLAGRTIPSDFAKENYFRPFPATRRGEPAMLVMKSQARKVTDTATMTLKINVGPAQPVGLYRNVISFTAVVGI